MIEKLKYIRKRCGEKLLYENMMICFYCKYWNMVNWCNLKQKRRYSNSTCEKWEVLEW